MRIAGSFTLTLLLAAAVIFTGFSRVSADMPTSQFLMVGQGARAEAMGESVVADCFDQSATFWNPAGMSFARCPEVGLNSMTLVSGITLDNVSIVYPYRKFCFGLRMITMSSIMDNVDSNGNSLPQALGENDGNYDFLASYKLRDYLSIGLGVGATTMEYTTPGVTYSASTTNQNFGLVYYKNDLSVAASVNNIGDNVKLTSLSQGEPQPEVVRLGVAYRTFDDKNLTIALAEEDSIYDKSASGVRFGAEYAFNAYFAARGGFIFENNGDTKATIGFGAYYAGFGFDFSSTLSPASLEDITILRFGLSYKFSVNKEVEE
jgi:hypothetical protein